MRRVLRVAAGSVVLMASVLSACAPIVVAGIVAGTALVATDRRTTGTQVDDQTIQLKVANELTAGLPKTPVHIAVNSFDRKVLLTGEVPEPALKTQAGEIAAKTPGVRAVVNELAIGPPSSVSDRAADAALGTRVRAAFVNTKEIPFNSIEIVTERKIIYLLGVVTEKEGDIAAYVASRVPGVQQVVKVFDPLQASPPAPIVTPPPPTK
jgi:osmotically-inducible protein OsmY